MINLADLAAITSLSLNYFNSLIIGYGASLILQLLPLDFGNTILSLIM